MEKALILRIILVILGISGFLIALYIRKKKNRPEPMVCPLDFDCSSVVKSKYSSMLGMNVESLGMLYYAALSLVYIGFLVLPQILSPMIVFVMLGFSIAAFIFSLYLIFVQAFVIKEWCSWCIFSALISTFILIFTIVQSGADVPAFLASIRQPLLIMHGVGFAIGVGAATITDIFFFKFLSDRKISESEADTMNTLTQVIWVALGILILSGAGLFIPESERLIDSSKFLLKMVTLLVIIGNGLILNLIISPKLIHISFGGPHRHKDGELHHLRKLAFALGAISIISWYTAFILGSLKSIPLSFPMAVLVYLGLLLCGIIGSQIFERRIMRQS